MMVQDDVLPSVNKLLPLLRDRAEQCEREREVPADSIALLRDTGVFRIFQPKRYGGAEGDLQTFFDAIAAIGSACASTGWVAGVLGTHQWVIANFPEQTQDDVWGADPGTLVSGAATPGKVTAAPVPGGYSVTGTWRFCSGCTHADWHFGGGAIVGGDPQTKRMAFFLLPVSDMTFVDNWFVNGLRGTASRDGTVSNVFVPEHRVLFVDELLAGRTPGQRINTAPLYRLANATVVGLGIAAPPIGATAGILAAFIAESRERERTGGLMGNTRRMSDSQILQLQVAEASTQLDAVLALIRESLRNVQEEALTGDTTDSTRVRVRRDLAYAVHSCVKIMEVIYDSAGTASMFPPNPTERAWRDVHAAAKHVGLNWNGLGVAAGRHLFGLPPGAQY